MKKRQIKESKTFQILFYSSFLTTKQIKEKSRQSKNQKFNKTIHKYTITTNTINIEVI